MAHAQKNMTVPLIARRTFASWTIPQPIAASPLMKEGGFGVFEGLLSGAGRKQMLAEALSLLKRAQLCHEPVSDTEEVRGGNPARCFLSAPGEEVQQALYHAPGMLRFLAKVSGTCLVPTGERGTFTYYARAGDHLSIHRDIETCDVAVITCLYDNAHPAGQAGMLSLYPGRLFEPLSAIRGAPDRGAVRLRLLEGQTIVMFGGVMPHCVLPVSEGQIRIVSVLCYRV